MRLSSHIRFNRRHLAANSTNPFFARAISTTASVCLPVNPTPEHQGEWIILESDSDFNTVHKESNDSNTSCLIEFGFGRNVDSTFSFRKPDYSMLERYATHVNTGFASSVISRDNVVVCAEKRGINGSTPAELLHVWEKGLFLQLMSALMGLKRAKKTASKRKKAKQKPIQSEPQPDQLLLNGVYVYDSNMNKKMAAKPSLKRKVIDVDVDETDEDDEEVDDYDEFVDVVDDSDQKIDEETGPAYILRQNGVFTGKIKAVLMTMRDNMDGFCPIRVIGNLVEHISLQGFLQMPKKWTRGTMCAIVVLTNLCFTYGRLF
jgi:hypothetical protein